jgi:hypothetical protein
MANRWFTGVGSPGSALGEDTDLYLDFESGHIFDKQSDTWILAGTLRAPAPDPALAPPGWHSGAGSPDPGFGVDGDFYLDQDSGRVFRKQAATWLLRANLRGPAGPQGPQGPQGPPSPSRPDLWWSWKLRDEDESVVEPRRSEGPPETQILPILEVSGVPPLEDTYFCWGFIDASVRLYEAGVYVPGATNRGGLRRNLAIVGLAHSRGDPRGTGIFFLGAFDIVGPFFIGVSYEASADDGTGVGGYILEHGCAVMRVRANYVGPVLPIPAPVFPIPTPR